MKRKNPHQSLCDWANGLEPDSPVIQRPRRAEGERYVSIEPDGYGYRYPDGIRFNGGQEVNGSSPIEALPYYFKSTVDAAIAERDARIALYDGAIDSMAKEIATARERLREATVYSTRMGEAADTYMRSVAFMGQYHLPALFRWADLWDAMNRAALPDSGAVRRVTPYEERAIQDAIDAGRICICNAENVAGPCPMHPVAQAAEPECEDEGCPHYGTPHGHVQAVESVCEWKIDGHVWRTACGKVYGKGDGKPNRWCACSRRVAVKEEGK